MSKTIAIDFDGVIHDYKEGWKDGSIYGWPVEYAIKSINDLIGMGYGVFIFSTRNPTQIRDWFDFLNDAPSPDIITFKYQVIPWWAFWVKFWNKKGVVGITNRKLPANIYIDDRCLKFDGDWINVLEQILGFKTWQGAT